MSHFITTAFDTKVRELQKQGVLTHNDLRKRHASATSTTDVSPTSLVVPSLDDIKYYDDIAADPAIKNQEFQAQREEAVRVHGAAKVQEVLQTNQHHEWRRHRHYDFRLTDHEKTTLQQHGIVVSERLGNKSFGDVYYRLYTEDMPVYITSDSILHAWHYSFDEFLQDLEMDQLTPLLGSTLVMILKVCADEYDKAVAAENLAAQTALGEIELFLTVAHSLLLPHEDNLSSYQVTENVYKPTALRVASNTNSLEKLLSHVKREKSAKTTIFGSKREVDFSLFKPRGHYTKREELKRYFRAMIWLGTVDFRLDPDDKDGRFQLQCACMLMYVIRQANVLDAIRTFLETVAVLTGDGIGSDSMIATQFHDVIGDRDILATYFGEHTKKNLRALHKEITSRGLGTQAIMGAPHVKEDSPQPTRPPTSFTFLGQQFVWSAFIFSKLTFDQVVHNGEKVARRIPSGVDVAFALFGNDVAAEEIAKRMEASPGTDTEFVKFRDGLPYTTNLIAIRQVVDETLAKVDPETASVAMLWQLALRELSQPSVNQATVFASETWQKRQMNTQLASFTQLRHDTILYAKQSSTNMAILCEYPAGYVDPYPSFWLKMHQLAQRMLNVIETLEIVKDTIVHDQHRAGGSSAYAGPCFHQFMQVTQTLHEISTAQAQHQVLTNQQIWFLKNVIETRGVSGPRTYGGWYPKLFYTGKEDAVKSDHLVADVHTDPPSRPHRDPGGILHMGVGDVNLALIVVDETMYAGPVFSHYEFVTAINRRLTDQEFSRRLPSFQAPQWARESFLTSTEEMTTKQGTSRQDMAEYVGFV